jgi:hypothetical protein
MDEPTTCAQSVLKVNRIVMGGVLSNPGRALVLKVLSASTGAWGETGTEMIEGSRIEKSAM